MKVYISKTASYFVAYLKEHLHLQPSTLLFYFPAVSGKIHFFLQIFWGIKKETRTISIKGSLEIGKSDKRKLTNKNSNDFIFNINQRLSK